MGESESTGNGGHMPDLLDEDASIEEIVKGVNGLAYEIQLVRQAVAELGKAIGNLETAIRYRQMGGI